MNFNENVNDWKRFILNKTITVFDINQESLKYLKEYAQRDEKERGSILAQTLRKRDHFKRQYLQIEQLLP